MLLHEVAWLFAFRKVGDVGGLHEIAALVSEFQAYLRFSMIGRRACFRYAEDAEMKFITVGPCELYSQLLGSSLKPQIVVPYTIRIDRCIGLNSSSCRNFEP